MADLVAFLNARLDEEEAAAKAATDGPWYQDGSEIRGHNRPYAGGGPGVLVVKHTWPQESAHIALNDPAHALREVEAKRAMVEKYTRGGAGSGIRRPRNGSLLPPRCSAATWSGSSGRSPPSTATTRITTRNGLPKRSAEGSCALNVPRGLP